MLRRCVGLAALVLCLVGMSPVFADDVAPDWETLLKQKDATVAKMREMQQAFQKASAEDRVKLQAQFREVATALEEKIIPQIEAQLPGKLEQAPDAATLAVASEMVQINFQRNRFPAVNKLASQILKTDPKNQIATNLGAVAKFATHDFEGAVAAFDAAREAELLSPQIEQQYYETSKKYVELWKSEQEQRSQEDAATGDKQLPQVKLQTSEGDIVLELFEDQAPNTVANFVSLVESKFYDGLRFHRVIPGFMAQGGCPNTRDGEDFRLAGQGGPGYTIDCESYAANSRHHFAGSISMAHAGKNTGGSQFFITHLPTPHLDKEQNPMGAHTVFGRVVEGMNVVYDLTPGSQIVTATVIRKRNHEYKPVTHPEGKVKLPE